MSRKVWTILFLSVTGVAVVMEVVAGVILPGPDRPAWTDLIVGSLPRATVLPAAGLLASWLVPHFIDAYRQRDELPTAVPATQVKHPWRATLRTLVAGAVGALPLLPELAVSAHVDAVPAVAQVLALSAVATRVLAMPSVNAWLALYLPWLAAAPPKPF